MCVSTVHVTTLWRGNPLFHHLMQLYGVHCSDDKSVASRIFENMRSSLCRYLGFVISINDEHSEASMFLSPLSTFNIFVRCEGIPIDLIPGPPIKRLAQRHIYLGMDAIAARDLGFAMARKATTSSLGRMETQTSKFLAIGHYTSTISKTITIPELP